MSTVSLTLHQTSTSTNVEGGASYLVTNVVTASFGVDKSVFVFKTDTGKFSHYATPADMEALPTSQEVAVADDALFYRQSSLARTWTTISEMNDDLSLTKSRLQSLAREVSKIQGSAIVDQVVEIRAG